ncbi:hypothetical protein ABZY19_36850 [Streptomyces sp. NPDC006475]
MFLTDPIDLARIRWTPRWRGHAVFSGAGTCVAASVKPIRPLYASPY